MASAPSRRLTALGSQLSVVAAAAPPRELEAAIIGATGAGNYGHGLDSILDSVRASVRVTAIADADADGRRTVAAARGTDPATYASYTELLAAEHPSLVVIAPRWVTNHHAVGMGTGAKISL